MHMKYLFIHNAENIFFSKGTMSESMMTQDKVMFSLQNYEPQHWEQVFRVYVDMVSLRINAV